MEIYAKVKKVETNNLACLNEMKCGGTLSIPYEGGKERNKWIKDEFKDQALKLFKSANFIDGKPENNFSVEVEPLIIDERPSSACSHVPRSACAIAYDSHDCTGGWKLVIPEGQLRQRFL